MPMADRGSQGGIGMWPSEAIATRLYDAANIALIVVLIGGVIATSLVVWMGNVKEEYLKKHLADTQLETARLQQANLELQKNVRGREITDEQHGKIVAATKGMKVPELITYIARDPEARTYGFSLVFLFQELGMRGLTVMMDDAPPMQTGVMYCGTGADEDFAFAKVLMDAGIMGVGAPGGEFGHDKDGNKIVLPYCPPGSVFVGLRNPLSEIRSPHLKALENKK
jgi:hypothetical protein